MATTPLAVPRPISQGLTPRQFHGLAEVPPEIEWFANLINPHTRRAYRG